MTARSALSRLNRNLAATAGRDPLPNRWPLDHVEMAPAMYARSSASSSRRATAPRSSATTSPECACQSDCADAGPTPLPLWQFLIIAAIPIAVIGGCVAWRLFHG
jgi:hypothetical protein